MNARPVDRRCATVSLQSEATLAAIGVEPILEGKPRFNQEQQNDARALADRMRALVLRFLSGAEDEPADLPAFDYKTTADLLDNVGEEQTHGLVTLLPEPLADEVEADATRLIHYLQGALPRSVRKSMVKATNDPPEPFELGRFRRKWAIANDPTIVLRDLLSASIDSAGVQALAQMFPATYQALTGPGGIVDEAIATMKSRRGDRWDLSISRDRLLRVLMQTEDADLDLATDFARAAAAGAGTAEPQPVGGGKSPSKPKDVKIDSESEQLPGQKAA
jgi:hypothetical protein